MRSVTAFVAISCYAYRAAFIAISCHAYRAAFAAQRLWEECGKPHRGAAFRRMPLWIGRWKN